MGPGVKTKTDTSGKSTQTNQTELRLRRGRTGSELEILEFADGVLTDHKVQLGALLKPKTS